VSFTGTLSGGRRTRVLPSLPTGRFRQQKPDMEVMGWVGTALVVVAYYPQIHHLYVERCAWGISVLTWLIWLAAGVLLLTYCVVRRELLMCVVQGVNITAIVTTLVLVRRSNNACPYHRRITETIARQ
jgi:uncharacterized protein with PQ loop repeat